MTEGERRCNVRVPYSVSVRIRAASGKWAEILSSMTRDLSIKGLYCLSSETFPVGTPCFVTFLHHEEVFPELCIKGRVARNDPKGMGILFEEMDIEALTYLRQVVSLECR